MNLLTEKWLPVRTRDGERVWVSPLDLTRVDLLAFDSHRPDFNGALAQFAIGLLQTTSPANKSTSWQRWYNAPPDEDTLHDWFAPYLEAFEFEGDGARFMQDFELRFGEADQTGITGIASLLIESPGDATIKNNSDLFIKRGQMGELCPHCAALALFTLQLNAPAGGAGHRTSLRGGGPLTTLLVAEPDEGGESGAYSLWCSLWLNVQTRNEFEAEGGGTDKDAAHYTFPWLASIRAIQAPDGQTTSVQVHSAHVFWAMPRRIRLDLDAPREGVCDLCGRPSNRLISRYLTRPNGLNYKGAWSHPLSPYYQAKDGMLPLHPQPGGLGYRHWLGWLLGMRNDKRKIEPAAVIHRFFASKTEQRLGLRLRLWAFGFDMDNMKARCWYDSTLPIYGLNDCSSLSQTIVRDDVATWLAGAELVASYLRGAVRDAWFTRDARGDFSFVDASFWSGTESIFYQLLRMRIESARKSDVDTTVTSETHDAESIAFSEQWLRHLRVTALRLFDSDLVGTGPIEKQNPERIANAYKFLKINLHSAKLRTALDLPIDINPKPKRTKKGKNEKNQAETTV